MPAYRLLVMRLADMHRIHPLQDDSRVCSKCQQPVGIYPSGQQVLRDNPDTEIVCSVCSEQEPPIPTFLAPGALEEPLESTKKTKQ